MFLSKRYLGTVACRSGESPDDHAEGPYQSHSFSWTAPQILNDGLTDQASQSADHAKWRYAPGGGECSELSYEPLPSRMTKTGVLLCSWRVRFRRRRARQLRRQASAVEHRQPETDMSPAVV